MKSILYYSLGLRALGTVAAPVSPPNKTSDLVHWEQEPNGRGTWGIFSTCTITMVLCVYTALHLNLPPPNPPHANASRWDRLLQSESCRCLRWILIGLFAPELVVYTAWMQRRAVKDLTKAMNARCTLKSAEIWWTQQHSWFLLMGGIVFSTRSRNAKGQRCDRAFVKDSPNLILTARGLMYMEDTFMPLSAFIDSKTIQDHSKSDALAKSLVCLQGFYMIFVCIARVYQKLPISQLEINTFGHALCALLMYVFWFDKPKDIKVAHVLRAEYHDIAAFLYSNSRFTTQDGISEMEELLMPERQKQQPTTRIDGWTWQGVHSVPKTELEKEDRGAVSLAWQRLQLTWRRHQRLPEVTPIYAPRPEHGLLRNSPQFDYDREYEDNRTAAQLRAVQCAGGRASMMAQLVPPHVIQVLLERRHDESRLIRLAMAFRSLENAVAGPVELYDRSKSARHVLLPDEIIHRYKDGVNDTAPDWPGQSLVAELDLVSRSNLSIIAAVALATTCYGAVHSLAWQSIFATQTECVLWRVSSLLIAASGVLLSLRGLAKKLSERSLVPRPASAGIPLELGGRPLGLGPVRRLWSDICYYVRVISVTRSSDFLLMKGLMSRSRKEGDSYLRVILTYALTMIVWLLLVLFLVARIYIVIEAYISLRSMPAAMYETPDWPKWVPHL